MTFIDRADAGRRLARELARRPVRDTVVLGVVRGGLPVAAEVARELGAPLDAVVARKVGVPGHCAVPLGALAEGDVEVLNAGVVRVFRLGPREIDATRAGARAALDREERAVRRAHGRADLRDRTAVVVDDGVATGSTARAACRAVRARGATSVVLAVPVAPPELVPRLADVADEVVCLDHPGWFTTVGELYADFAPVSDSQVAMILGPPRRPARSRWTTADRR